MNQDMQNDVKGIFATVTTGLATVMAWLPQIEAVLRVCVSVGGLVAAYYAASYWRAKRRKLNEETDL